MKFFVLAPLSLIIISCSSAQKVSFHAIEPAQEDQVASIRTITFDSFLNDRIGAGGVIEGVVGGYSLDGSKPYFKVVERKNLSNVLAEQELSSSWAVDPEQRVRIGKLIGAQGIFGGEVLSVTSDDATKTESRSRCSAQNNKGVCVRYESYNVTCHERTYGLSILVKLVDSTSGNYVFTKNLNDSQTFDQCPDRGSIPGSGEVIGNMLKKISSDLLVMIAPTKYLLNVTILEDMKDVDDPTDGQEKLFDSGLEFAKVGRADKSLVLFKKLGDSLSWKSYVVNYNYAVLLEATGDLVQADKHYKVADDLAQEPVEEINEGVARISARIEKGSKLAGQLKERD